MVHVEIYTKPGCPYCVRAKELLDKKGVEYEEKSVAKFFGLLTNREVRFEMISRSKKTTVPQIFVDGKHLGGCDDLYGLDAVGKLDAILKGKKVRAPAKPAKKKAAKKPATKKKAPTKKKAVKKMTSTKKKATKKTTKKAPARKKRKR